MEVWDYSEIGKRLSTSLQRQNEKYRPERIKTQISEIMRAGLKKLAVRLDNPQITEKLEVYRRFSLIERWSQS